MTGPAATPRVLSVPERLQHELDRNPRAFYAGCSAARDGFEVSENPYTQAAQRRAWASGWLAVHEGWVASLDHHVGAMP